MIVLPTESGKTTLYMEIYRQLRAQITSGALAAGTKLPSKRALASQLGVSVNTVDGAYGQLQSEGYVESKPKSGYYVCKIDAVQRLHIPKRETAPLPPQSDGVRIDFSTGGIASEKFPFSVWQRLLKAAMDAPDALSRTHSQGNLALRQAVVDYLHAARGVRCDISQVVIGAGTDSLLSIISYILPNSCTLAVENPVYNRAHLFFSRMGHPVIPAEIDKQGVMLAPLAALDNVALYTTPSHQFPLGVSMPMGRRTKLLNWAGQGRFRYIIEDDYDSEFRYDARPVPSLQSIDHNGRVIYLGTFSRSVAPSIRVSYMVLPPELAMEYKTQYAHFSSEVSGLEQQVLADFMTQGYFETHVNRMRVCYRNKRRLLSRALAPLEGKFRIIGEAAGHHLALQSECGHSEAALCARALDEGVRVYPISPFFMGECPYEGKVLLGFGGLREGEILEGAAALCRAWQ